jgi:hypothetical protein
MLAFYQLKTVVRMIGVRAMFVLMFLLIMGTAFTAYARIAFMAIAGEYTAWTDLVLPHTLYTVGTGIFVPLLGLPLSKWVVQRLFSTLEEAKMLYADVFTNGGVNSMHHDYTRLIMNKSAIESIVRVVLSVIVVLINVTVTVSHKSNVGMLIVPILNFGVLFLFRTPSKKEEEKEEKKEDRVYVQFCRTCNKASGGIDVCSSCASNQSMLTQIRTTIKIGLITLLSECMCLFIFASSSGNGAMIVSYISIAWMMRLTMDSCNSLGEKGERDMFNSLLYLWTQLQRNQLPYNRTGLSIESIKQLQFRNYEWNCGIGCIKTIPSQVFKEGVYLFNAVKGTGKSTFLTSLLKNSVKGLHVLTEGGTRCISEYSLMSWWDMVFYMNNLAGLTIMDRTRLFNLHQDIAKAIGLCEGDALSSGCSTGQGCLWALLSLLSMLPTDRGIVLILDELLSNVELSLRQKIYEEVLPTYFPQAIIIVVDHGYTGVGKDINGVDFASITRELQLK